MIQLCPRCRNPAVRIPRRRIDRLISRLFSVQRYKCESMVCTWIGNVRAVEPSRAGPPLRAVPSRRWGEASHAGDLHRTEAIPGCTVARAHLSAATMASLSLLHWSRARTHAA